MLSRRRSGKRDTRLRRTVDLPTPEGPERTIRLPIVGLPITQYRVASRVACSHAVAGEHVRGLFHAYAQEAKACHPLFHVLNLFADTFERGLYFNDEVRDLCVVRLGADRVDFTAHFLGNEF